MREPDDCPICNEITPRNNSELAALFMSQGEVSAVGYLKQKTGILLPSKDLREHVYHHPVALKQLVSPKAADENRLDIQALPRHERAALICLSRSRGIPSTSLNRIIFPDEAKKGRKEGISKCNEMVRRLQRRGYIYEVRPALDSYIHLKDSTLFLGASALSYVEMIDNELATVKLVSRGSKVAPKALAMSRRSSEVISELFEQFNAEDEEHLRVSMEPYNWFGPDYAKIEFVDPVSTLKHSLSPAAIGGFTVTNKTGSLLSPAIFHIELTGTRAQLTAEQLVKYLYLSRAGSISKKFPQITGADYFPPILVVCEDVDRLKAVQEAFNSLIRQAPIQALKVRPTIIMIDRITFHKYGVKEPVWRSIWSGTSRKSSLPEVLARAALKISPRIDGREILTAS